MVLEIKGYTCEISVSIGTFSEIVDYMRRYESHRKMSLTKYIDQIDEEDYRLDLVVDLVYYPHAIAERKKGLIPILTYADCFEFVVNNKTKVQEIFEMVQEALPKPEPTNEKAVPNKKKSN